MRACMSLCMGLSCLSFGFELFKLWEKNRGAVISSSPPCRSSYRLIRTDNGKTSSGSQPTSKPPFLNHKSLGWMFQSHA